MAGMSRVRLALPLIRGSEKVKEELPPLPDKMHNAFAELYERSLGLMEAVCPTSGVRPLQEILGPLQERTEAARPFFLQQTAHLSKWLQGSGSRQEQDGKGIGLNTVGMLSDRLSILAIKQHRLRLQERDGSAKAIDLFQTQTLDILAALSIARPGNSAINTKITTLPAEGQAANWIEAYFGLLTTN